MKGCVILNAIWIKANSGFDFLTFLNLSANFFRMTYEELRLRGILDSMDFCYQTCLVLTLMPKEGGLGPNCQIYGCHSKTTFSIELELYDFLSLYISHFL